MSSAAELEAARNEILRKIGRNLFNFQRLERLLKLLTATARVEGPPDQLRAHHERRVAEVERETLGQLTRRFFDDVCTDKDADESAWPEADPAWIRIRCFIGMDGGEREALRQRLAAIIEHRNHLVHAFAGTLDLWSDEGCQAANRYLDRQHEECLPQLEYVTDLMRKAREGQQELAAFMNSETGDWLMHRLWMQGSRLVSLLTEIASTAGRADGWTSLDYAQQLLRQDAPEEVAAMAERYGHHTIEALMTASGLFEMREEQTARGGMRRVYRPLFGDIEVTLPSAHC